jgi:hypothetical protein
MNNNEIDIQNRKGLENPRLLRILIGYRGDCPNTKQISEIVGTVWTGPIEKKVIISAFHLSNLNWNNDKELAMRWKALQVVLEYKDHEIPYWKNYQTKACLGQRKETGEEFYVEAYYE